MPTSPKSRRQPFPKVERRENSWQRGYNKTWRQLRADILKRDGFRCQRCGKYGDYSFHVDHIVPFSGLEDPRRLDEENLQVLCPSCHSQKTAKEDGLKSERED